MTEKNTTRDRLLKATAAAIDKGGEGAVRIRDLTKSCNITAPSIYHFFGSREGLIDAAQAFRFSRGQLQLGNAFASAIHQCKNKAQFVELAHQFLTTMFSYERRAIRNVRLNVLGNAVNRPDLSKQLSHVQEESNKVVGESLRYAQSKGWVRDDFNGDMFAAWLNGMVNSRRLIEMNGIHPLADEWDVIAKRSICVTIGIPEPARKNRSQLKSENN